MHYIRTLFFSSIFLAPMVTASFCWTDALHPEANRQQLKDITYKTVGSEKINLDLYVPTAQKEPTPVVVFIHGGSWVRGDKSIIGRHYFQHIRDEFLNNGYAVASINYRLSNPEGPHFPEPIVDCKDAVRWLRKNAGLYGLDARNIGLWGVSAGGHLGMMAAYSNDGDFRGDPLLQPFSADVDYIISHYAPTDLPELFQASTQREASGYEKRIILSILGKDAVFPDPEKSELLQTYSPASNIKRVIPTLTFHGNRDQIVPFSQAEALDRTLKKRGVPSELVTLYGEGHGFISLGSTEQSELLRKSLDFARKHTRE